MGTFELKTDLYLGGLKEDLVRHKTAHLKYITAGVKSVCLPHGESIKNLNFW